jgi:Amidohydrolase family
VLSGLINAHYHSHDTLCRGLFEELPLEIWLLYTLPLGQNRSKEEVRARTLVGAIESLRCGITTVQDMYGLRAALDIQHGEVEVLGGERPAGGMVPWNFKWFQVQHKPLIQLDNFKGALLFEKIASFTELYRPCELCLCLDSGEEGL